MRCFDILFSDNERASREEARDVALKKARYCLLAYKVNRVKMKMAVSNERVIVRNAIVRKLIVRLCFCHL